MSLFTKRHYEWLAYFAAEAQLSTTQIRLLSIALYNDSSNFRYERFMQLLDNSRINRHTDPPTQYRGTFTTHNTK